jgi:hypothetical protein
MFVCHRNSLLFFQQLKRAKGMTNEEDNLSLKYLCILWTLYKERMKVKDNMIRKADAMKFWTNITFMEDKTLLK